MIRWGLFMAGCGNGQRKHYFGFDSGIGKESTSFAGGVCVFDLTVPGGRDTGVY